MYDSFACRTAPAMAQGTVAPIVELLEQANLKDVVQACGGPKTVRRKHSSVDACVAQGGQDDNDTSGFITCCRNGAERMQLVAVPLRCSRHCHSTSLAAFVRHCAAWCERGAPTYWTINVNNLCDNRSHVASQVHRAVRVVTGYAPGDGDAAMGAATPAAPLPDQARHSDLVESLPCCTFNTAPSPEAIHALHCTGGSCTGVPPSGSRACA